MKRRLTKNCALACSILLLACMSTNAMADGLLGLHVAECNGTSVILNTCASNMGTIVLVGSVQPPVGVPLFNSVEFGIDVWQAGSGPISQWWNMDAASGCLARVSGSPSTLSASFDFTATDTNGSPVYGDCADPWGGTASGGMGIVIPSTDFAGPASARMTGVGAMAGTASLDAAVEYYMFQVRILKRGTVGTACDGCNTPTTIFLIYINLGQPNGTPGGNVMVTGDGSARQYMSYNGGVTAARAVSWGAIKAIYH